ncbi:MAG: YdeI/OmpD-associated family protein [bacterium]|nr:YdeI/OmpD-associated family protein [Candidatus Kapabacteria bacterium]
MPNATKPKKATIEMPLILFKDQDAWEKWLAKNHEDAPGVWLQFAKKNSELTSVNYKEALDVALCYGWIDSLVKSIDADTYMQKFTPRGKKSLWSQINREKVAVLTKAKKMRPAGVAAVEAAKADGRWDAAYSSPSNATVPDELQKALNKNRKAKAFFETLNKSNRYAIIWRIQTAKKPETKTRRVEELVAMLTRGEKIHM